MSNYQWLWWSPDRSPLINASVQIPRRCGVCERPARLPRAVTANKHEEVRASSGKGVQGRGSGEVMVIDAPQAVAEPNTSRWPSEVSI
jgi:hypothetical protein